MLGLALVRAIEIIGVAASKASLETRAAASSVHWPAIIAMRNRLIHGYFDIDHDVLWKNGDGGDSGASLRASDDTA